MSLIGIAAYAILGSPLRTPKNVVNLQMLLVVVNRLDPALSHRRFGSSFPMRTRSSSRRLEGWAAMLSACCPWFETALARLLTMRTLFRRLPQLVQQLHERLALLRIERRQRLARNGKRVRRSFFRQLLAGARQTHQQAAAVFGVG